MLALIDDKTARQLQPDYYVTVEDLYTQVTLSIIRDTQNFNILEYIPPRSRLQTIPSWAPDWSIPVDRNSDPIVASRVFCNRLYAANGQRPAQFDVDTNHKRLTVKGRLVDTIKRVAGTNWPTTRVAIETLEHWTDTGSIEPIQHTAVKEDVALMLCGSLINSVRVRTFPDLAFLDRW
jgi:hypothetical protein